ncbi:hypothetical protein GUITHDRAFT_156739 [Guillardia theta CCMP2712]|uniref:Transmembrane protein n=3 Tax=Guillardia theta TaxID=55529 RepID=L1I465_GUITC|nr:hypothetical protein GUITHDRAFT_156739 [Guillardia theta CCMP2712]EKX30837.1 hypothetical protein GUITHDRAFT_156739 [Guillardia theta CCMP2712]|mmetsp:Transcript_22751/g.74334  ORF Transcript_22751/g.74334 Transcript_22751/m.74334 type:complete len:317 (+) Transcript_22751:209-1159(+)|eukprot:XP_005817817.1 hypothetical protein GUITHDRAFT_156739 [Guillardia theta CCMP2712]
MTRQHLSDEPSHVVVSHVVINHVVPTLTDSSARAITVSTHQSSGQQALELARAKEGWQWEESARAEVAAEVAAEKHFSCWSSFHPPATRPMSRQTAMQPRDTFARGLRTATMLTSSLLLFLCVLAFQHSPHADLLPSLSAASTQQSHPDAAQAAEQASNNAMHWEAKVKQYYQQQYKQGKIAQVPLIPDLNSHAPSSTLQPSADSRFKPPPPVTLPKPKPYRNPCTTCKAIDVGEHATKQVSPIQDEKQPSERATPAKTDHHHDHRHSEPASSPTEEHEETKPSSSDPRLWITLLCCMLMIGIIMTHSSLFSEPRD